MRKKVLLICILVVCGILAFALVPDQNWQILNKQLGEQRHHDEQNQYPPSTSLNDKDATPSHTSLVDGGGYAMDALAAYKAEANTTLKPGESVWVCFCVDKKGGRSSAPSYNASREEDRIRVCTDGELQPSFNASSSHPIERHDAPPKLLFCLMQNICITRSKMAREYEGPYVFNGEPTTNVNLYLGDDSEARRRLQRLPAAVQDYFTFQTQVHALDKNPFGPGARSGLSDNGSSFTFSDGNVSTQRSLAMVSFQVHHQVPYHGVYESTYKSFANLHMAGVAQADIVKVPVLDTFMLNKYSHDSPISLPKAFNMVRWDNMNNPLVSHMCFKRPVIVGGLHWETLKMLDMRNKFREYVLDAYLGVGATAEIDATCQPNKPPLGRILYMKRSCPSDRCIKNTDAFEAYLRTLEGVGFKVTIGTFTSRTPMDEQIRLSANADIIIGPHGSGLIHAMWLSIPCGMLVEIFASAKHDRDTGYFKDLMPATSHPLHLSYHPNSEEEPKKDPSVSPMTVNITHFHDRFTTYLANQPRWKDRMSGFAGMAKMEELRVNSQGKPNKAV